MDFLNNPAFWSNLQNWGFATMAAGAKPGATTLGAIGEGGMAMNEAQKQQAVADYYTQNTLSKRMENEQYQRGQQAREEWAKSGGQGPDYQIKAIGYGSSEPRSAQEALAALDLPGVSEQRQKYLSSWLSGNTGMQFQLQEVYDPNSPSGTRYVRASEALGQSGKPSKGQRISVGADGQVTIEDGVLGIGGGAKMGAPTQNKLNEKLINSTEMLSRLSTINSTFKPEYLQLPTKAGMAVNSMKDYLDVPLDDRQKQSLTDYTVFRQNATENLNRTLNELSGAAVSPNEAERLKAAQPNAGTGVFDGDSPTVFKAKLDNGTKSLRHAVMRYNWALNNGMDPLKTGVDLDKVPKLIEREGAKIEREVRSQMPTATDEQVDMEVKARLGKRFGLR